MLNNNYRLLVNNGLQVGREVGKNESDDHRKAIVMRFVLYSYIVNCWYISKMYRLHFYLIKVLSYFITVNSENFYIFISYFFIFKI